MMAVVDFEQVVEQRAVIDDGLAKFLSAGFAALTAHHQSARDAVVLDHMRMVDRNVLGSFIEVLERITACGHDLRHEVVRLADRGVGIVDETCLDPSPLIGERVGLLTAERMQLEPIYAVRTLAEGGLSLGRRSRLANHSVVFRPEPLQELLAKLAAQVRPRRHTDEYDCRRDD